MMRRFFTFQALGTAGEHFAAASSSVIATGFASMRTASYSQRDDPGLRHFMKKNERIVAERAVTRMARGVEPSKAALLVKANPDAQTRRDVGLHELVPRSLKRTIAGLENQNQRRDAALIHSGARSSTALTPLLNPDTGELGGHVGAFNDPRKRNASTHTSVQASSHEHLRAVAGQAFKERVRGRELLVRTLVAQTEVMPTGPQIMQAGELDRAQPNLRGIDRLEAAGGTALHNRALYAQRMHAVREGVKRNARALWNTLPIEQRVRTRPPTPRRTPMDASGAGGEYMRGRNPVVEVPRVPRQHALAHEAAWATKEARLAPDPNARK